uniref:Ammonium transporter n=1 Tax=Magnetococcus massalia (strain MO-1) TaxID=451514 RepID=A0A1S7LNS7_MAGMO|nr:ammonium transport protein (Amt family) [Candidatus Magnetococcus massalia]
MWARIFPPFIAFLSLPGVALAADKLDKSDTAWILTATALVLFMTLPGLALFYGGLVRSKNILSILMQCFAIACLVSVLWLMGGYTLAFGDGGSMQAWIGNLSGIFFSSMTIHSVSGTLPEGVFAGFQMTFAIITPALVIGGFAERIRFNVILPFTFLWLLLVYIPVCHWVWGGGWLAELGVMDFAGGIVVHITAGVAALVAALVLGPRRGFQKTIMVPHNLTMTYMGAAMLWVGWFGFNGGSALTADGAAGWAILATHMGAAAGSLAWMAMEWIRHGKPSVLGIVTGMVAGLGTVTPASGFISPMGGFIIGIIAGVVCYFATQIVKQKLKIDDSLDVFPVHGVGGIIGSLMTAIFAAPMFGGHGLASNDLIMGQLSTQTIAVVVTALYTALVTWVIFKVIAMFMELRVDKDEETEGLDLTDHDERGYNISA